VRTKSRAAQMALQAYSWTEANDMAAYACISCFYYTFRPVDTKHAARLGTLDKSGTPSTQRLERVYFCSSWSCGGGCISCSSISEL
jgi:hypothetical protein